MTKAILVTSTNARYHNFAQDLILSIIRNNFDTPFDLGLIDTGLTEEQRDWYAKAGVTLCKAENFAGFPNDSVLAEKIPGFKTLTEQLYMRDYFPDYDVYVWMDADSWVQTPEALNVMISMATKQNAILIAPEIDRCYDVFFQSADLWNRYHEWYQTSYGPDIAAQMALKPMFNVGVWAMRKDSAAWQAWIDIYLTTLKAIPAPSVQNFMAHQLGLNIGFYLRGVPHIKLPARYNWLTALALPMYNTETHQFVEPSPPYQPIAHIHLTRPTKAQNERIQRMDGGEMTCSLMYRAEGRAFQ